jgi:hypothetical protein
LSYTRDSQGILPRAGAARAIGLQLIAAASTSRQAHRTMRP